MNPIPRPVFVGFFPKRTLKQPEILDLPAVEEICSVSACISKGPEGWIDRWVHNGMGCYDGEDLALSVAGDESDDFDLYAYEVFPMRFRGGMREPWVVPVSVPKNLSAFEFLGYDPVSRSGDSFFECSPLSCNYAANDFPVNRHCLIDSLESALAAARAFSQGGYEPGPYLLCGVYRKRLERVSSRNTATEV